MRLIDADVLMNTIKKEIKKNNGTTFYNGLKLAKQLVQNSPTINPSDAKSCKNCRFYSFRVCVDGVPCSNCQNKDKCTEAMRRCYRCRDKNNWEWIGE